jgi:hypothetical protein
LRLSPVPRLFAHSARVPYPDGSGDRSRVRGETVTQRSVGAGRRDSSGPADLTTGGHNIQRVGSHSHRLRRGRLLAALLVTAVSAAAIGYFAHGAQPTAPPSAPVASVHVTCKDRSTDAVTLQRAIDSSPAGAAIEFQGGRCLLTTGLRLLGNRTYTGENTTGTVLQQAGSASYILASSAYLDNSTTTGDPLSIRDLTVSCDGSGNTDGIILLNWQADVENVNIRDCGGSGIVDTNINSNGRAITNTSVNSRFDNNFILNSGRYGFYVHDTGNSVTDGFLQDNQIASSGLDAVHLDNAAGWYISGNHLYRVGQNAINANRLFGTTISGNYIEDFGDLKTSQTWYGILGSVQDGFGSTIVGNKVFNSDPGLGAKYVHIGITHVNSGTGHLSVTGNVIEGNRGSGIGILVSGGSNILEVSIYGNQIANVGSVLAKGRNVTLTSGS